jgi:hypothetical protein
LLQDNATEFTGCKLYQAQITVAEMAIDEIAFAKSGFAKITPFEFAAFKLLISERLAG